MFFLFVDIDIQIVYDSEVGKFNIKNLNVKKL